MQIRRLLHDGDAADELLRSDDPAEAHAGRERLGERPEVNDQARLVHRCERRHLLAAEAKFSVRVVLNDRDVVAGGELHQLYAAALLSVVPFGLWNSGTA